ncbi:hypothetical protein LWI28_029094 [Acer negundo]|uniref:Uncharacterized protein n=1 Tax=Acer negundo TaxID=4023 RepID=A0AAD5IPD4_ACENE|nr:hypothetical protein LWI28_029094 [Acer negundo]
MFNNRVKCSTQQAMTQIIDGSSIIQLAVLPWQASDLLEAYAYGVAETVDTLQDKAADLLEAYAFEGTDIVVGAVVYKQLLELKSVRKWDSLLHPPPLQTSQTQGGKINRDRSHHNYDMCSINGPTVLDPKTSTFYLVDPHYLDPTDISRKNQALP